MRAPQRKYAGALKVPHATSGTNSPSHALLDCRITGYRDRQRVAIGLLKLDDSDVYVSTRKGKRVLVVRSCPSFSTPVRLASIQRKAPASRGRGFELDRVRPLQSPVSPGTLHLVRAVSFYRFKFLDCLTGTVPNSYPNVDLCGTV
jgi:hypothetical protein